MLAVLCIWVHDGAVCLAVSSLIHTCTRSHGSHGLRVGAIWNFVGKSVGWPWFSLSGCFRCWCLSYFYASLPLPLFFPLFPKLSQCDGCRDVPVWRSCGWVVGIASHGSVLLSRSWLITVEAHGHPGHPPSTQRDTVVNRASGNMRWWDFAQWTSNCI